MQSFVDKNIDIWFDSSKAEYLRLNAQRVADKTIEHISKVKYCEVQWSPLPKQYI